MINSPTEQTVRDYIDDLEDQWFINNQPAVWDRYRAHFELVANSPNVPIELKRELRNVLLKKGVSRLIKID